jgi:hypothetical protein
MSQHDGQLPEDLRDIADRLFAARVTPSRFELDELYQRVYGRVEGGRSPWRRRRFATVLRMNFVAALLTLGLVLTSGVGVVLASEWFGGGSNTYEATSFHNEKDASWCEYYGKHEHDYSFKTHDSTVDVDLFWDCKHLTVHFFCDKPFGYKFGNGPTSDIKLTSDTVIAPTGSSGLTVSEDGYTSTIPLTW